MKTRVISAIVLVLVILILFILGGQTMLVALFLLSLAAIYEFCSVVSRPAAGKDAAASAPYHPMMYISMAGAFVWYLMIFLNEDSAIHGQAMLYFITTYTLVLMAISVFSYPRRNFSDAALTLFSTIYTAVLFSFIYFLREADGGLFYVWYIIGASWGCDTFSYFVGMIFGRHKLAPVLSPKKTVEGAIGGVAGGVVLCTVYGLIIANAVNVDTGLMLKVSLLTGLIGSIVSIFGDLFASSIKRIMKVKDYSNLIPGHGGILDRFDSVLFVAPVTVLIFHLFKLV